jgi:hypothetical protein
MEYNFSKTEYMECNFIKRRIISSLEVKVSDHIIPQVTQFKYLRSIVQNDGKLEDVNHRSQVGWLLWRASCILGFTKIPPKLKEKMYQTVVRPKMLYGTLCRAVKNQHKNKLSIEEMRMLCWMCGKTRRDKIRNDNIRECWASTYSRKDGGN